MKKTHLPVLLAFCSGLLFSCSDDRRDIRDYYFPVADFKQGQVYAYASVEGDTTDRRYWYYQAFVQDSGTFLVGTQYDRYFAVNQLLREKIVDNGSIARTSYLYEQDTATGKSIPIHATIESPDLFPFQVRDSLGVFLFRIKYSSPADPGATIYRITNRRYLSAGPDFEFEGKKYPTIRFGLREAVGNKAEGNAEIEGQGEEWYAQGLGLVYYRKSFNKGAYRFAYRLKERFSMSELERRALGHEGHDH